MVYKVNFSGTNELEEESLNLTFKSIEEEPSIVSIESIKKLKNISEDQKNIITFKNIDLVSEFLSDKRVKNYEKFIVLLVEDDHKKSGFLIGRVKKSDHHLIGYWPFNKKEIQSIKAKYDRITNEIIENPQKFKKISVIY